MKALSMYHGHACPFQQSLICDPEHTSSCIHGTGDEAQGLDVLDLTQIQLQQIEYRVPALRGEVAAPEVSGWIQGGEGVGVISIHYGRENRRTGKALLIGGEARYHGIAEAVIQLTGEGEGVGVEGFM